MVGVVMVHTDQLTNMKDSGCLVTLLGYVTSANPTGQVFIICLRGEESVFPTEKKKRKKKEKKKKKKSVSDPAVCTVN